MGRIVPEDLSGLPAGWLAQRMLAEANNCPSLIGRTGPASSVAKVQPLESAASGPGPFPAMALLSDPALDIRQYLEDLVTIAVSSAQQAEDVASQAHQASKKARRGMFVIASFGALGLMVGAAGFAASRSSNVRLSEVRQEVTTLQAMQRQANQQISDIASRAEADHDNAVEAAHLETTVQVPPLQPPPPVRMPPVSQHAIYSDPWPDSRPVVRHAAPVRSRQVVVPQFFADIQRNFRAIFR